MKKEKLGKVVSDRTERSRLRIRLFRKFKSEFIRILSVALKEKFSVMVSTRGIMKKNSNGCTTRGGKSSAPEALPIEPFEPIQGKVIVMNRNGLHAVMGDEFTDIFL